MPIEKPRIVFMGTPEFAVASLDALVRAGYPIAGVITAPDKPAGRGMQLNQSAVKKWTLQHLVGQAVADSRPATRILQPEKLKNPEFLEELRALKADLQIVVAFRMLPESVWNMPPMGTVNLHGSLLPQYRGAAPINWAVINGETRTGVTTFKLQHAIDTGNILLQENFPIGEKETAGDIHDRMKEIGASLLVRTAEGLTAGTLKEVPQENAADLRHAPKIFTETCRIDWNQPVATVYNLIRGLSPSPGAFTTLDGKLLKIYNCEKETGKPVISPGHYTSDKKTYLEFACPDGSIRLGEIQLEGKKKMGIENFLRGYKIQ
jgi:methionyl-tRNA formyltransferase